MMKIYKTIEYIMQQVIKKLIFFLKALVNIVFS